MNHARYQTLNSATRAAAKLDSLLVLSRSLARSRQDGVTSEALDLLLAATGYTRGAAYAIQHGELQLIAHRGLPSSLRERIERLPVAGPPWFIAQSAVQARTLVSAREVSTAHGTGFDAPAFAAAGWAQAIACPIAAGRELHGVMMLAGPMTDEADDPLRAVLEIACQLLALQIPRRPDEHRSDGAGTPLVAALGVLACGFMSEIDEQLAVIERDGVRHERLLRRLSAIGSEGPARELEAIAASSSAALQHAREIAGRLFSAFHSALPAAPASVRSPGDRPRDLAGSPVSERRLPPSSPGTGVAPPPDSVRSPRSSGSPGSPGRAARASKMPPQPAWRAEPRDMRTAPTEPAIPAARAVACSSAFSGATTEPRVPPGSVRGRT